MMHGFLIIPTSVIPEWTKQNVPTYRMGRFSNSGAYMLIDDAHPAATYAKWLGPNADQLPDILAAATSVSAAGFAALLADPSSDWYATGVEE